MSVRKQTFGIRHLTVVPTNFEPSATDEPETVEEVGRGDDPDEGGVEPST